MDLYLPAWADTGEKTYDPSPPQSEFMRLIHKHDRVFFIGGLGSGKSWAGAWAFLILILWNRARMQESGRRGRLKYLVGAPTYQLIDVGPWAHILTILEEIEIANGFSLVKGKPLKTNPRRIHLITNDTIEFVATDAGRYAGANAAGAWLDEGEESDDPMGSHKLLGNRLRDIRAPRRFLITTSTPNTDGEGIYPYYQQKIHEGDERFAVIRAETFTNPIAVETGYYEDRKGEMSQREVEARLHGIPQPPTSSIFGREFDEDESVDWSWPDRWRAQQGKPNFSTHFYGLSFDWGSHYSCLLIEHCRLTGRDVVIGEHHEDGVQDHEFLDAVARELLPQFGLRPGDIRRVRCDWEPPDAVREARKMFGHKKVVARRMDKYTKRESIEILRWRLNPEEGARMFLVAPALLTSDYERGLVRSIKNYKKKERRVEGRIVTLDQVHQDHWASHACDAARYWTYHEYRRLRRYGGPRRDAA